MQPERRTWQWIFIAGALLGVVAVFVFRNSGTDAPPTGDDPAVGPLGNDPFLPIKISFQGAVVSPTTGQADPATVGPWRDYVGETLGSGLLRDQATGFRFQMIFNIRDFPNVVVRRLSLFYRT